METSRVEEECDREDDTQASVGGADLVESPDMKQNPTYVRVDEDNQDANANPEVSLKDDGEGDAKSATMTELTSTSGLIDEEYAMMYVSHEVHR
ncbi:hypothetical protein PI126_g17279 [Phytophthora idaei]|nr:hypothetical protein PI126_g17279 [Phytophthora idaei]